MEKNAQLINRHGVCFADVVSAIEEGGFLEMRRHPNAERYGHQMQMIVEINAYAFVIPCIVEDQGLLLKTLYPSRKTTAEYIRPEQ